MQQINPNSIQWDDAPAQQGQSFPGVIRGNPKPPPTPDPRAIYEDERDTRFDQTDTLGQRFRSLDFVKEYPTVARQYSFALQTQPTPSGDQALIVAYAKMLDPGSVVREAEFDTTAAADSALGRTVSRIKRELGFEGGGRLSEEARNKVRSEMRTLAQQYDTQYQEARQFYSKMAQEFDLNPEFVVGSDYSQTYADVINKFWDEQAPPEQSEASSPQGISLGEQQQGIGDDGRGNPLVFEDPENGLQALVGYNESGAPQYGPPDSNAQIDPRARGIIRQLEMAGPGGLADVRKAGITLGLSDEASGIGQAIGGALTGDFDVVGNYQTGRDIERFRLDQARAANPVASVFNEIGAGGAGIVGRAGAGVRAARQAAQGGARLTPEGVQQQLVRNARTEGAGVGALGGFGYGEGFEGSTSNALLGGVAGGAIGQGGQMLGNRIANRQPATSFDPARATQVARAGNAEGVTVNRAMIDPRTENTFSGVEATRIGGPRINRQMNEIEGQVEGRIATLGGRNTVPEQESAGGIAQSAVTRRQDRARGIAGRLYDQADNSAGGISVQPSNAIQAIDRNIAELEAAGANANRGQIKYLQDIREDIAGGMTIRGLRDQRTNLRGQINERNLGQTDAERRIGEVLDAASQDIEGALQNNAKALRQYKRADAVWRDRAQFRRQIERDILGPADNPKSGTQAAKKLESFLRDDTPRFRRVWESLDDAERGELRGYIANALGRNAKGEFSPAIFLNNMWDGKSRIISEKTARIVFGEEGVQSLKNLKTISEEVNRLNALRNRSNTGRVNNYGDWLLNALGFVTGGGAGAMGGSLTALGGAAAGTGAVMGARATKTALDARMLMNPKISKWIATAPKTAKPEGIDRHFAKLGEIARTEPAIANEVESLRRGLMQAANDNVGVAAVAEEDSSQ